MSDWCPENDGAYRDEQNAIYNRKIEEMMEPYYGLEVCIGVILSQSKQHQTVTGNVIHEIRITDNQKEIFLSALDKLKESMIEMCGSK
jgi:hypothetical protein